MVRAAMRLSVVLVLGLAVLASAATSYHGYKVVSVWPKTHHESWTVQQLVNGWELDQWSSSRGLGSPVDLLLPPKLTKRFLAALSQQHIHVTVKINDVQQLIEQQGPGHKRRSTLPGTFDHTVYHNLGEIYSILDGAVAAFPHLVSLYTAGTTYEGRDIRVAKVSSGEPKPVIWIDCGIHAREWISSATCQYILDQLTSGYGSDGQVTDLLDTYDFHIMPCANPDGYNYTWNEDRLWRKNRSPHTLCKGVDCNRNFDSDFGGAGTSDIPCSDLYHGPSAFSERESAAVRDAVLALDDVAMFYSLHSYAQLWMTPYGYTTDLPANYDEQVRVAEVSVRALEAVHGTQYQYGNIADIIYMAAGGSIDWVYDTAKVPYTYGVELRDQGEYGFLLPEDQILPTGEETWAGIVAGINAI
ncbi:carboxypeptidase B [Procambarus clarkii]|uniref:carboxypeptidase B n=1 Tax=Procambarus clarkii TaxID=6728 RepID=UPI003743A384